MGNQALMRRLLTFTIKALISAFLLYFSLRRVNLGNIGQRPGGLDLWWMAQVFGSIIKSQIWPAIPSLVLS